MKGLPADYFIESADVRWYYDVLVFLVDQPDIRISVPRVGDH